MEKQTKVSPALVIGIGPFAQKILTRVSKSYFDSDPTRRKITKFVALYETDQEKGLDLASILQENGEPLPEINFPLASTAGERQKFIENLVKSADQIRASLNVHFHEIRTHDSLMEINLDKRLGKNINLYVVADLTDALSSAALMPIAFLLQDIMQQTHNTLGNLMLNISIFPDKEDRDDKDEVGLFSSLLILDKGYRDVSDKTTLDMLKAMGIKDRSPLTLSSYLFDYRKPNGNDARDVDELELVFGNSLLGLMLADIPQTLSFGRPMGYIQKNGSFYSSIGASCLSYDPDHLIEKCVDLFSSRIISEGFLGEHRTDSDLINLINRATAYFGDLPEWYSQLSSGKNFFHVSHEGQLPDINVNIDHLYLSPMDFEDIRNTPWQIEVADYSLKFKKEILLDLQQTFDSQAIQMASGKFGQIVQFLSELVGNPGIYPQGVSVIKRILKGLDETTISSAEVITKQINKLDAIDNSNVIQEDFEKIQTILKKAKSLPIFWRFLPRFFRKPLSIVINLEWIIRNYLKLEGLRRHILMMLAEEHSARIEAVLLESIKLAYSAIKEDLGEFETQIDTFDGKLKETQNLLALDFGNDIFKTLYSSDEYDPFRSTAIDPIFAEWAYQHFQQPIKSVVLDLLVTKKVFDQWEDLSAENFSQAILAASKDLYLPLRDYHLDQVLEQGLELRKEQSTHPDEVEFNPYLPLIRSALPMMRPNFDAIGGSEYSTKRRYFLAENKSSPFVQPVLGEQNIKFCQVDDRRIATAVTVRDLMPLEAFTELNSNLQWAYDKLNEDQKEQLKNVFVPIPTLEGTNLTDRSFTWKFGNPEEDFSIVLPVDERRYHLARLEQRLDQPEWYQYVLEDSQELNYLAACFLNLFLQHPEWTRYDQTNAILAFVQQGIKYALDKDTTPLTEWPRSPIETLYDQVGDCEDVAILTAAIMNRLGFHVALLLLPGHCAMGIAGVDHMPGSFAIDSDSGYHYYYAEATATGWSVGKLPEDYQTADIKIQSCSRLITKES
ncbi:transglutaminase domain-containing protein [Chloroflexota bacterium]|nr:transglutaminase domain-containing protein [Chloroflexota bacterium]